MKCSRSTVAVTSSSSPHFRPIPTVSKQTLGPYGRSTVLVTRDGGSEKKPTVLEPINESSLLDGLQEMSGGVYEDPQDHSVGVG